MRVAASSLHGIRARAAPERHGARRTKPRVPGAALAAHAEAKMLCLRGAGAAYFQHALLEQEIAVLATVMLLRGLARAEVFAPAMARAVEGGIAMAPHGLRIDAVARRERAPRPLAGAQPNSLLDLRRRKLAAAQ